MEIEHVSERFNVIPLLAEDFKSGGCRVAVERKRSIIRSPDNRARKAVKKGCRFVERPFCGERKCAFENVRKAQEPVENRLSWIRDLESSADRSCQIVLDLNMPWNCFNLAVLRVGPKRMASSLALQNTSMLRRCFSRLLRFILRPRCRGSSRRKDHASNPRGGPS